MAKVVITIEDLPKDQNTGESFFSFSVRCDPPPPKDGDPRLTYTLAQFLGLACQEMITNGVKDLMQGRIPGARRGADDRPPRESPPR